MNLPQPGTPEFEKLISGQPKKDWTKLPELHIPKPGGSLPIGWTEHATETYSNITNGKSHQATLEEIKAAMAKMPHPPKSWMQNFPVEVKADHNFDLLKFQIATSFKPVIDQKAWADEMMQGLLRRWAGQLDCTEIEAQRTARCFDWTEWDRSLDALKTRICG